MPVRSLTSSVLKWPDAKNVIGALSKWAQSVLEKRKDILLIGYFGSYARAEYGVGSDLDILIILDKSDTPFIQRATEWDVSELPVPADVVIYTETEWLSKSVQTSRFGKMLADETIWICRSSRFLMQEALKQICRRYHIADIYAFGSRAGEIAGRLSGLPAQSFRPHSDLDIAVLPKGGRRWSPAERVSLAIELEDLFQVKRVDLVVLSEAEPFLALDVIRGELLYTDDPNEQARCELYVLRRAGDLLPFKKQRIQMILEEGAR